MTPGEPVTVLGDAAGLRVALVRVHSRAEPTRDDTFLVRQSGTGDELDGLVLIAERRPGASGLGYYATVRGQPRSLVFKRSAAPLSWGLVQANQVRQWARLEPVDDEVSADDLLALYRSQEAAGRIDAVAPRGRAQRQRAQGERFATQTAEMREACGVEATIHWESVDDRMFDELSVSGSCSRMAESVAEFCQLYPHTLPALQEKAPIVCSFEGDPEQRASRLRNEEGRGLIFEPGATLQSYADIDLPLLRLFGEEDQLLRRGDLRIVVRLGLERLAIYGGKDRTLHPIAAKPPILSGHFRSENLLSGSRLARLSRDASGWTLHCGDHTSPLENVVGEERARALAAMTYESEPKYKRELYVLARDSQGTYYVVDRYRQEFGGQHYRVFIGRRGQVTLSKLKGLIDDSEGTLFSTEKGELRLLVGADETAAIWIRGNKETPLTTLSTTSNRGLVFDELGMYFGEDLGLPCDAVNLE